MTVVLLVIDPVLALVALATAPLMAALSYVYRRRVRSQARVRRAQEGHIASIASEALSAMAVVKAFGSEGYESRARARGLASAGSPPASRWRGCRPASTGSSAR